MAVQLASFELGTVANLTLARVDFDEPESSGFLPTACQNANLAGTVRLGTRLTVDGSVLEMGTAYPGYGCLFTYAAFDGTIVYSGPLRANRKSGVAYAIRRKQPGDGWGFYENGTKRGPSVLSPSATAVSEVLAFVAFDDSGSPDPVLYPVTVKLRAGFSFGDMVPWPAGWWDSTVTGGGACAVESDRMTMKATFVVNYGACTAAAVAQSTQEVETHTSVPVPGAPPPPAPLTVDVADSDLEWSAGCIGCGGFHQRTVNAGDVGRTGGVAVADYLAEMDDGAEVPAS